MTKLAEFLHGTECLFEKKRCYGIEDIKFPISCLEINENTSRSSEHHDTHPGNELAGSC